MEVRQGRKKPVAGVLPELRAHSPFPISPISASAPPSLQELSVGELDPRMSPSPHPTSPGTQTHWGISDTV